MAKGIASGFVLSGIAAPKAIFSKQKPGSIGGTYAGNAVSCAAAVAVIDVFEVSGDGPRSDGDGDGDGQREQEHTRR